MSDAPKFILAATLSNFAAGIAFLYLNFYFRALGLDDRAIGALNAAPAVGLALVIVPTFLVADRFPRRWVLLCGGALSLAATIGVVAASSFLALLPFAALFGAGDIVTSAAGMALLAESREGAGRTRIFGLAFAATALARFVASALGGSLAAPVASLVGAPEADVATLRALLLVAAGIGASSGIPVLLLRARERPPHLGAPRQWRLLARFLLIWSLFGFGAGNFLPYLNLFFADRFRLSFGTIGVIVGVISVGGGLGGILHTRLAPRLGDVRAIAGGWIAALPFAVLAAFAPVASLAAAALVVRGVVMGAIDPTFSAFTLASLRARERAAGQAALGAAWAVANGAGALTAGLVREALGDAGYTANILTLVVVYALVIALFARGFARHVPRGDAVESAA